MPSEADSVLWGGGRARALPFGLFYAVAQWLKGESNEKRGNRQMCQLKKETIDKCVNRARVVATQVFTRFAFWFKKLVEGIKAMARWLADKTCAAIKQLKEKASMKKEEIATVSTSNETSERAESPEKESLSLQRDSRFAAANTNDETASSTLRGRLDLGMLCFLGFGVGMAIIGGCLGYLTYELLTTCMDNSFSCFFIVPIFLTSAFVIFTMLVWALYLGMLTNGRQGFATTFKGWVTVIMVTIFIWTCIGFRRWMEDGPQTRTNRPGIDLKGEGKERIKGKERKKDDVGRAIPVEEKCSAKAVAVPAPTALAEQGKEKGVRCRDSK